MVLSVYDDSTKKSNNESYESYFFLAQMPSSDVV